MVHVYTVQPVSRQLPIRIDEELRARLTDQAFSKGISVAALIKQTLAVGIPWPPTVARLLDAFTKETHKSPDWILRRIVLWFGAGIEAERRETGKVLRVLPMFSIQPEDEMNDEQVFDFFVEMRRGDMRREMPREDAFKVISEKAIHELEKLSTPELIAKARDFGVTSLADAMDDSSRPAIIKAIVLKQWEITKANSAATMERM